MSLKNVVLKVYVVFSLMLTQVCWSQDFSEEWTGHFSYLDIRDISQGSTKIFGAAENAIFIYNKETNEIETLSTINGLSGETISAIKYIEDIELLVIGFENGLIQIYNETNNDVFSVVDIVEKTTIEPGNKKINHFNVVDNIIYISTDYGISLYNYNALEFGDTFFIGPNGTQIVVNQTTIFEDYIYAALPIGVKKGLYTNPNLIDYQEWITVITGNWIGVQAAGGKLFISNQNRRFYEYDNGLNQIGFYPKLIKDIRSFDDKIIVTTEDEVHIYSTVDLQEIATVINNETYDVNYSCAMLDDSNTIYVGSIGVLSSGKPGFGILKTNSTDTTVQEEVHPESPLLNRFFKIKTQGGHIYGTHGGYDVSYNPYTISTRKAGVSHFFDESWQNIPYAPLEELTTFPWSLSHISINPSNPNLAYISSSIYGVLQVEDNIPNLFFNGINSTIQPFLTDNHFVHASTYDKDGVLWVMNARYESPLNRFKDGQWTSFSFLELINPPTSNNGFSSVIIDDNDNFFMGTHQYGLVGFNLNGGNFIFQNIETEEEGMPSPSVQTIAIDNNSQLWLGTDKGLRIVYNTNEFMENPEVDNIVVLDDGIPRELLFQQYITDIEVDGSNNKWVATLDTGLYYFSSDGQETLFHFTTNNSPLPTNNILDVDIDGVNGIIYIATEKGLVAFKSDSSKPKDNLENAFIYPNPVRPSFNIVEEKIKIRDISDNVNIKITDIEGNLVAEAESRTNSRFKGYNLEIDGGTALWNGKNLGGNIVASGVYLVMLSDLDTFETKVLKVMVVR